MAFVVITVDYLSSLLHIASIGATEVRIRWHVNRSNIGALIIP